MVNDFEFDKQFKNLGIDHESVKNAGKILSNDNKEDNNVSKEGNNVSNNVKNDENAILKRKIDYLTNTLLPKIEERFHELDNKIERYASEFRNDKKDYIVLRNELDDIKKKVKSARVVFGEEAPKNVSNTVASASNTSENRNNSDDDVRIDKIFNYSNHKFS